MAGPIYIPAMLPVAVAKGSCPACSSDWPGDAGTCERCEAAIAAIVEPEKKHQADALAAIAGETAPNVLAIAHANAGGDWRRAAISKRLGELGYGGKAKES